MFVTNSNYFKTCLFKSLQIQIWQCGVCFTVKKNIILTITIKKKPQYTVYYLQRVA